MTLMGSPSDWCAGLAKNSLYEELCNTSTQEPDGSFESQTEHMKAIHQANIPLHEHLAQSWSSAEWFGIKSA